MPYFCHCQIESYNSNNFNYFLVQVFMSNKKTIINILFFAAFFVLRLSKDSSVVACVCACVLVEKANCFEQKLHCHCIETRRGHFAQLVVGCKGVDKRPPCAGFLGRKQKKKKSQVWYFEERRHFAKPWMDKDIRYK